MNPWRVAIGLVMILTVVAGIGWFIWQTIKRADDPAKLALKYFVTLLVLGVGGWAVYERVGFNIAGAFMVPFVCVFVGIVMSILWAPHLGALLAKPLTSLFDGGDMPADPQPLYSVAESRRKQGRFHEAVWEIRGQLEKFPNDVVGQMMLAEIQAENLNDLPGAQLTVDRFIAQPGHGPKNIAFALNSLADWHLKFNRDVEAARMAVQLIIHHCPDTEVAMVAAQRLAHLADADAMAAALDRKPLRMRHGVEHVGLRDDSASLQRKEEPPAETAARLVRHLEAHPLDAEAREKLAAIYSGHYGRLDLAIDQLEQLVSAPNQPGKEVARWLNAMADLQVAHGADYETVRATLQRIIDLFPGHAPAQLAQQRIERLRLELKGKEAGGVVHLGSYEKNLGLKRGKQ